MAVCPYTVKVYQGLISFKIHKILMVRKLCLIENHNVLVEKAEWPIVILMVDLIKGGWNVNKMAFLV